MKKAVFPGSFDPLTLGHCDIINKSLDLFDEIIIAIGENSDKKNMFSMDERKKFIHKYENGIPQILRKNLVHHLLQ